MRAGAGSPLLLHALLDDLGGVPYPHGGAADAVPPLPATCAELYPGSYPAAVSWWLNSAGPETADVARCLAALEQAWPTGPDPDPTGPATGATDHPTDTADPVGPSVGGGAEGRTGPSAGAEPVPATTRSLGRVPVLGTVCSSGRMRLVRTGCSPGAASWAGGPGRPPTRTPVAATGRQAGRSPAARVARMVRPPVWTR